MRTCLALLLALAFAPAAFAQPAKPAGLTAVPTDSFAFVTVNAGKLWDTPDFKPLRDWFAAQKVGPTDEVFGLPAADIDRVTLFMPVADTRSQPVAVVTTKKPYNEARLLKALPAGERVGPVRVGNAVYTGSRTFSLVVLADANTLVCLPNSDRDNLALANLLGQILAKKTDGPLATALADATKHDIAVGIDARPLAALLRIAEEREATPYLALLKVRTVTFAADFDKSARGALKLQFADAADAKRAAPVLKEAMSELAANLTTEITRRAERMDAVERLFFDSAVTVLKAAKVEVAGTNVFATADVPYRDAITQFAAALPKSYSAAVSSAKGQNNMKQLLLAMHNFESANGIMPGDVLPFGMGQAWSWRVQILPYVEQENLYRQVDFTKAWDAPENLKKLEAMEMPKLFEVPGRPAPKGHTYFRIFSRPKNAKGNERPWLVEGEKGPRFIDVTDGTSNTLMIVEAGEAVPWYKPDVFAYDGKLPLPQLGDKAADRFLAGFGDGSTRVLRPSKLGEKTLRALITPNGGEIVELP